MVDSFTTYLDRYNLQPTLSAYTTVVPTHFARLHYAHTPQRHNTTPRSPPSTASPSGTPSVQHGYTGRPIEIPPVEQWKPDVEFHDTTKVNGLDFPCKICQSRFSSYKDIEGMDPLQVPLWKFLYQGIHNTWLRRIAYGRETFVIPFDNIGTTVFIAELVAQLRSRNVDLDKLATSSHLLPVFVQDLCQSTYFPKIR